MLGAVDLDDTKKHHWNKILFVLDLRYVTTLGKCLG
jgi:hypothetical protein